MTNLRIGIYGVALEMCIALITLTIVAGCVHRSGEYEPLPKYDFPNIFDEIDKIKLG